MQGPNFDGVYPYMSYITADGDEIVLSSEGIKSYWETYGRRGFDAPPLRRETRQYADGSVDILAIIMEPRPLTVEMVAVGSSSIERDNIMRDIASRLIQVGSRRSWGKLKVRRNDGKYLYIDCAYVSGLETATRDLPRAQQFELEFWSGNGYFYDTTETTLTTATLSTLFYLDDDLYLGNDLYLNDGITDISLNNDGELFYPQIDIFGPASVIRLTNSATGKTIALDGDFVLLSGEKLTIDCREHHRKITLQDNNDVVSDITEKLALGSSLIWDIAKGQNVISVYYTDSDEHSFARIRYQRRYFSA
jgi:hypothetical protein